MCGDARLENGGDSGSSLDVRATLIQEELMRIEQSDWINRPPAEVFRVLTDMGVFTKWNQSASSVKVLTPGPIGLGSRMLIAIKGFGDMEFAVTAFDPERKLTVAAQNGRMAVEHTYLLGPENGGTRLNQDADVRLKGLLKIMAPLMNAMATKGARKTTEGLIGYAESQVGAAPSG
jgi:carbon monoxide dehydrogenase subunit G